MGWRMERKLSDDLNKKERNEELASLQEKREKREIFWFKGLGWSVYYLSTS